MNQEEQEREDIREQLMKLSGQDAEVVLNDLGRGISFVFYYSLRYNGENKWSCRFHDDMRVTFSLSSVKSVVGNVVELSI